ncbi:MAG: cell division protein FtsB [Proteobacteria bacterium]|nr:cell division protein FtsB [Pseudomonadota bacterium]
MNDRRAVSIAVVLLLGLLAWLQYRWWFGRGGHRDVVALEHRVEAQVSDNATRQQRNDALAAEVHDLKDPASGGAAIEERARNELGMVKPGETFYRVVHDPNAAPAKKQEPETQPQGQQ